MSETSTVPVRIGARPIHPRHGLHAPRTSLLPRRAGSIRRTVTIDTIRPGGILGDAIQIAVGRDLRTDADGPATVVREARLRTELAYSDHYRLIAIESDPARDELQSLVGTSVSTGFRAAMMAAVPSEHERATLLYALLDDLPGAALVSGYAIGHAGKYPMRKAGAPVLQIEGLCAGFQRDGTILAHMSAEGTAPVVTGPDAPTLVDADDPLAWHDLRVMGAHDMRRWRRLDVVPGATPSAPVEVEAYFRDSHVDEQGRETVIHEYTVARPGRPGHPGHHEQLGRRALAPLGRVHRGRGERRPPRRTRAAGPAAAGARGLRGRQHVHAPQRHDAVDRGRARARARPSLNRVVPSRQVSS